MSFDFEKIFKDIKEKLEKLSAVKTKNNEFDDEARFNETFNISKELMKLLIKRLKKLLIVKLVLKESKSFIKI